MYPPDFDPGKKYPVFIEPYAYAGFSGSVGQENSLQVYAASGFIVLSFGHPLPSKANERFGRDAARKLYSKEPGFPDMTMLMESTLRGLDTAAGSWSANEYYWPTRKGREMAAMLQSEWRPKPVGEGLAYWRSPDIAEHIDQIEAPILMHDSLSEAHIALRFMHHLDDEGKPYDAYVFTNAGIARD